MPRNGRSRCRETSAHDDAKHAVSTDPTTLGALAWIYVKGAAFTAQIQACLGASTLH